MPILPIDPICKDTLTAKQRDIVEQTAKYVKESLAQDSSGHDWWHIYGVWRNAVHIGHAEAAPMFIVELAALLHDIADYKFHGGDTTIGPRLAREWLTSLSVDEQVVSDVCEIIEAMSFKGAAVAVNLMPTLAGQVVQDADRLEAIGATGVARTFAYGGAKGRQIYDPAILPELHDSFEKYKSSNGPTINHFYEKLLLLKERLNTPTAQVMAQKRHDFMLQFLDQFFKEFKGIA